MAKVKQKAAKHGAAGTSTRGGQVLKQRNKHKVVLESTSKEQNKLQSVITFRADPPAGYTFIPAGNPELTAALKEFARRGDNKIYAVTTTPHAARHELSREVHRIGFHFPTSVVAQVCAYYGIRLTSGGKLIDESKDDKLFMKVYQNGQRPKEEEEKKDQVTINTEAKQVIKDLFPNIPDKDLFQIIKTAFQLGDNKVGTADEIPLVRRAQLSVVAHIRHVYTKYDKLWKKMSYNDARHAVEQDTLTKLIEWRGDNETVDEATQQAANELLREVIVISDEDDSEIDSDGAEQIGQDNLRIEELPSTAYGSGPGRPASPVLEYYDDRAAQGTRVPPRVVRQYKPTDDEIAERDRSRYAVWDQAKRDYRSGVIQRPSAALERVYEPDVNPVSRVLVPLDPPAYPSGQIHVQDAPVPSPKVDYETRHIRQESPRTFIRDANGTLYERVVKHPREAFPELAPRSDERRPPATLPTSMRVRTRPSSPHDLTYREHRGFDVGSSTILPSVEGPDGTYLSPRARHNPFERRSEPRDAYPARGDDRGFQSVAYIDRDDHNRQSLKRHRLEEVPPLPEYRVIRRESPVRHPERMLAPLAQSRPPYVESRAADYSEPRSSPQFRAAALVSGTRRFVESHSRDDRDLAPVHRPASTSYDLRETAPAQSRRTSYLRSSAVPLEAEMNMPRRESERQAPAVVSRVYEPVVEPRAFDGRTLMDYNVAAREHNVQAISQDYRTRYVYPPGSNVPAPLEARPRQRVLEYIDGSPTASRMYAPI